MQPLKLSASTATRGTSWSGEKDEPSWGTTFMPPLRFGIYERQRQRRRRQRHRRPCGYATDDDDDAAGHERVAKWPSVLATAWQEVYGVATCGQHSFAATGRSGLGAGSTCAWAGSCASTALLKVMRNSYKCACVTQGWTIAGVEANEWLMMLPNVEDIGAPARCVPKRQFKLHLPLLIRLGNYVYLFLCLFFGGVGLGLLLKSEIEIT